MASANNEGLRLDHALVAGNGTDGFTVQSGGYSRIRLKNDTRVDFSAGSSWQIFERSATLTAGMSEVRSPAGQERNAKSFRIQASDANLVARVRLKKDNSVVVMALNAPVTVRNSQGMLVAKVLLRPPWRLCPGLPR